MGWWAQMVRDTLPDRTPDPPASQPAPLPAAAAEDQAAAEIIRNVVDAWPGYEPEET